MIYKILHRKLKTEQHEPTKNRGMNSGAPEGVAVPVPVVAPVVLLSSISHTSRRYNMAAYFGFRHHTCIYNENYLSRKFVLYREHFHLPEFFQHFQLYSNSMNTKVFYVS
jgi:hypothetical protein